MTAPLADFTYVTSADTHGEWSSLDRRREAVIADSATADASSYALGTLVRSHPITAHIASRSSLLYVTI